MYYIQSYTIICIIYNHIQSYVLYIIIYNHMYNYQLSLGLDMMVLMIYDYIL